VVVSTLGVRVDIKPVRRGLNPKDEGFSYKDKKVYDHENMRQLIQSLRKLRRSRKNHL
jgi:hypothetical protein